MLYWTSYSGHKPDIKGTRKKYDNTIYTFDIETTSYYILDGNIYSAIEYQKLNKKERERAIFRSCMYTWQFSVNDTVYYGRTWKEFKCLLNKINELIPEKKIIFIHNLAFEFQYLKGEFNISDVIARKSRKVMAANLVDYNFELRCSYFMSNCSLEKLADLYNLPVKKLKGDLDYELIRTNITPLTEEELGYCENDCLVVYYYIKFELETYETITKIPRTSTGHVRQELKDLIRKDYAYKRIVSKSVNTDPHVYNLLVQAFQGGYTHANFIYTDEVIKNVDSWDFTSSYPYVLVTHKYPATKFKPCRIKSVEQFNRKIFAYLCVVKFTHVKSKYYNHFLSKSKCIDITKGVYDNGRIISAESFTMVVTDVDFDIILQAYHCNYEILECYYSIYKYLPKQFINFILDKYVIKTQYKGIKEKELEYQKEKSKFNSLYGMSVTNNIRDKVDFDNDTKNWSETPITNEEIIEALKKEEKDGFMSFAWGVWVTAYARNNLIKNIIKLDDYVIYCDTDSIKVVNGYDKSVIDNYNEFVYKKIKHVSEVLQIPIEKFAPEDIKGVKRPLGVFDDDGHYLEFITQGAKKYAVKKLVKDAYTGEEHEKIEITVSGVPKRGYKALKDLNDFRDNFVFEYKDTGKNLLVYTEEQEPNELTDYLGNTSIVTDRSGCCILPTTYELGKAEEYANLLTENSSARAVFNEEMEGIL